jgi:hypothetical protein
MIDAMLLAPCLKVLAAFVAARLSWWVLGDLVLEHVGIPFLDAGWRRADARAAAVTETPDREAVARVARWIERPAGVRAPSHPGRIGARSAARSAVSGTAGLGCRAPACPVVGVVGYIGRAAARAGFSDTRAIIDRRWPPTSTRSAGSRQVQVPERVLDMPLFDATMRGHRRPRGREADRAARRSSGRSR